MRDEWQTGNPPDRVSEYLVQFESGHMAVHAWMKRTDKKYAWVPWAFEHDPIIAWQPLPAPYEKDYAEWTYGLDDLRVCKCSKCGNEAFCVVNEDTEDKVYIYSRYCPHCGAKMKPRERK